MELFTPYNLQCLLQSLFDAELRALREQQYDSQFIAADQDFSRTGPCIDSLEKLHLAGIVNQMFGLHRSGVEDYLLHYNNLEKWAEIILKGRQLGGQDMAIRTSGSSGAPKWCEHSWAHLVEEAQFFASQLASCQRLLNEAPLHHLYGLIFAVLVPAVAAKPVVHRALWSQREPSTAAQLQAGDGVIGFPASWQSRVNSAAHWPQPLTLISSTAPLPASLAATLRQHSARLLEVYGSSETSGIGWRIDDGAYQLLPWWQRQAHDRLQRADSACTVVQDDLDWQGALTFNIDGRKDGALQVGGHNVFPRQIEASLAGIEGVNAVTVRPFETPAGMRLKAFVAHPADTCTTTLEKRLREYMHSQFKAAQRPVHFTFGTQLPRNTLGKLQDWPTG